jgi:hypothetical protein
VRRLTCRSPAPARICSSDHAADVTGTLTRADLLSERAPTSRAAGMTSRCALGGHRGEAIGTVSADRFRHRPRPGSRGLPWRAAAMQCGAGMKAVAGGAIAMRIPIINPLLRCFFKARACRARPFVSPRSRSNGTN